VIVRVMGEGQFRLEGDAVGRLNELDDRAQEALERDDESELDRYLEEMAALVKRDGERLHASIVTVFVTAPRRPVRYTDVITRRAGVGLDYSARISPFRLRIWNSTRRFFAHAASLCSRTSGMVSP